MQELPVNVADLGVLAIVLVSALLAFARGFTKEVLSIIGWLGAAAAAWYLLPHFRPFARQYIGQELIADALTAVVLFAITLILLSLLFSVITSRVRDSGINALDRSLGFVFGLVRGVAIVALAYLILVQFAPAEQHPSWLREARTLPAIRHTAEALAALAPADISDGLKITTPDATFPLATTGAGRPPDAAGTAATPPDSAGESGYKTEDRKQLDRLFGTSRDN